jgi:poly-gamma-glutamate system protein
MMRRLGRLVLLVLAAMPGAAPAASHAGMPELASPRDVAGTRVDDGAQRVGVGGSQVAIAPAEEHVATVARKAERLAQDAMATIRSERERRGQWVPLSAYAHAPARAALLGAELTPLVSTMGPLEAKWVATDPRWAAALARQFFSRGIGRGAVVLASFSGSFPGLNLAVMAAAEALGARVVAVSSVTASTWGASEPGFTWPEMEVVVVHAGVLPAASAAITLGASSDAGRGLDPEGLALAQRIQQETARALGAEALKVDSLDEAITARLDVYQRALAGRRPGIYVNVGGNHASLGGAKAPFRHAEGWITGPARAGVATGSARRHASVLATFVEDGVPALNLLNVRRLAREWNLEGARP